MKRVATILVISQLITGCAKLPPVTTTYPATRSFLNIRAVQTVGCDEQNHPVSATALTQSLVHVADHSAQRTLQLAQIDGAFANSDIKLEFYGDGRLKGINAVTTGQGEAIVKAATSLAAAAFEKGDTEEVIAACKALKARFKDKPLTLAFETRDDLTGKSNGIAIRPDWQSEAYYDQFKPLFGEICLRFGKMNVPSLPVTLDGQKRYALVEAVQPAQLEIAVSSGGVGECEKSVLWSAIVAVAHRGQKYSIPIPKAAVFGKQAFAASFDEAGSLTLLQYGKDNGTAGAIGAVNTTYDALHETRAETISELKSEADLIAAQQRLVKCQTTPASC